LVQRSYAPNGEFIKSKPLHAKHLLKAHLTTLQVFFTVYISFRDRLLGRARSLFYSAQPGHVWAGLSDRGSATNAFGQSIDALPDIPRSLASQLLQLRVVYSILVLINIFLFLNEYNSHPYT
jgi:hypothetical protein